MQNFGVSDNIFGSICFEHVVTRLGEEVERDTNVHLASKADNDNRQQTIFEWMWALVSHVYSSQNLLNGIYLAAVDVNKLNRVGATTFTCVDYSLKLKMD